MQKRFQSHKLAKPHSWVNSAYLNPTYSFSRIYGALRNRYRLNVQHTQASQEKTGRELFSIDLSIDLVRRLINAQLFQACRKITVGDFFPLHLNSQDFPCLPFPFGTYFGRRFLGWHRGVRVHIDSELFGLFGFTFNGPVFYDRKPIINNSQFLYESINHFFRSYAC